LLKSIKFINQRGYFENQSIQGNIYSYSRMGAPKQWDILIIK